MTRRVLVARLDSMGDVLLAGPAVRRVAGAADVVLLCGPRGKDAGELLPGVDSLLVWDAPWISDPAPAVSDGHVSDLLDSVRAAGVDEAVILTSFHQSPLPLALLLRLAGIRRITGASVDYPGSLLDVRLRPGEDLPEDIPETERACAIADAAGFPAVDDGRLRVLPPPDVSDLTGTSRYVVLHPGAAVPARRWPAERFARAAELLARDSHRVVVTGGAGERDVTALVARAGAGIDLGGACDLAQLSGVLAAADAVVVGNTGPAHLAAATCTPVVSLFSPVVPPIRWAPYGVPAVLLGDQRASCRDSRARECPVPGHPCLTGIAPERVVFAMGRLVGEGDHQPTRADGAEIGAIA